MKKLSAFAILMLFVPAIAGAQIKPVPPAPPAPPAPMAPKASPAPPAPPSPVMIPDLSDAFMYDVQAMKERVLASTLSQDQIREITDNARRQAELAREDVRAMAEQAREMARSNGMTYALANGVDYQQSMGSAFSQTLSKNDSERSAYDRGQAALSQRQYEQAILRFDQAITAKGTRTDGALYWKAFAQFKLGRSADANTTLGELQKSFKDSKYVSDAKALEAEIKRTGGQAARPENEDDEDLKLLALQGLINSDPERAIPLVQGVLTSAGSLKLKERALFVLAQSNAPLAHTILINTAKSGTPDLQLKAINYLGFNRGREGGKTSTAELMEIYNSSQNDDVKAAILRAFGSAGDRSSLVNVINGGNVSTVLRSQAISQLGSAQGQTELWTLYQKETNKDLKMQILSTLGSMGAYERVIEVARTEKEVDVRNRAIRSLGSMKAERSGAALIEIYGTLGEVDAKKAVVQGLSSQNNAEGLIACVRKENSLEMKKYIVERLANMPKNKAAQDYLMEIIK